MSIFRRVLSGVRTESRSINASSWWPLTGYANSYTGISVSHETAMGVGAFYACVRLISDHISTLPVDVFQRYPQGRYARPKPAFMVMPNPDMTWPEFMAMSVVSELTDGNIFWGVIWGPDGLPDQLWPLDPRRVVVRRNTANQIEYRIDSKPFAARDMIHIKAVTIPGQLRGISVVESMRQTLGLALAEEKYAAKMFAGGATSQVALSTEQNITNDTAQAVAERFDAAHAGLDNVGKTVVFGQGIKPIPFSITPEQAQMLGSRVYSVEEIARWLGVPLVRIQSQEKATSWGTGIEQMNIGYIQDAIVPRTTRYEARLNPILQAVYPDYYCKFNVNGLLRGDMAARAQYHQTMVNIGAESLNEVRGFEDLNPFPGGDSHYMPLNYGPIQPDGTIKQAEKADEPTSDEGVPENE